MAGVFGRIGEWWCRPWPSGKCVWIGPDSAEMSSLEGPTGLCPLFGFRDRRLWRGAYVIATCFDVAEDGALRLHAYRTGNVAGNEVINLGECEMEYMRNLLNDGNRPDVYTERIEAAEAAARRFAEKAGSRGE